MLEKIQKNKKILGIIISVAVILIIITAVLIKIYSDPNYKSEKCSKNAVNITVTVNQWASIAKELAGECGTVNTIINGTDVDPHEYEPTPADINKIEKANILVINGLDYDQWAIKNNKSNQKILNIGEISGHKEGDNPHLWYDVNSIYQYNNSLKEIIEKEIGKSEELDKNWQNNNDDIDILQVRINMAKERLSGNPYIETEGVAEYLLNNLEMQNITPENYLNAVNNESEPSINDTQEIIETINKGLVLYLIYNTQEENETTKTILEKTNEMGIKKIDVTEQMPATETKITQWLADIVETIRPKEHKYNEDGTVTDIEEPGI